MADITTDGVTGNRTSRSTAGVHEGEIWPKSDANFFQNSSENQRISHAISVSIAGVYAFTMANGVALSVYLAAGILHPIHAKRYLSTGTTGAGDLIVWF